MSKINLDFSNLDLSLMRQWRHQIHAHPETAYEEVKTATLVKQVLESVGIEVHDGIATTGVVGVLKKGTSERSIGLRADMDALDIHENNNLDYCSQVPGKMHACGHDGHTAMLLGAAIYLAKYADFDGTVVFIFQPAEEVRGGAREMIEQGLFERFPVDQIYGMHNMPGITEGTFSICKGPMMAAFAHFECTIHGKGGHSSAPYLNIDPINIGSKLVSAWQEIITQDIPAQEVAVIATTEFHAGTAFNITPESAVLRGSCRSLSNDTAALIEKRMTEIANEVCSAAGATCTLDYHQAYPVLVNEDKCTEFAADVARSIVGSDRVTTKQIPFMGSEDFAEMLLINPGAYIFLGNGLESRGGCMIHNPGYDFNDNILKPGAQYWISLACEYLSV